MSPRAYRDANGEWAWENEPRPKTMDEFIQREMEHRQWAGWYRLISEHMTRFREALCFAENEL